MATALPNVLLGDVPPIVYVLPLVIGAFLAFLIWCAFSVFPKSKVALTPLIIIVGVAFVLTGITGVGSFINGRSTSSLNACVNNLRQLEGAKQMWALENHKGTNDVVTWEDVLPYFKVTLQCPKGGTYILGRVGQQVRCSYDRTHVLPSNNP